MVDPILASEEDWRKAAQQWANKTWIAFILGGVIAALGAPIVGAIPCLYGCWCIICSCASTKNAERCKKSKESLCEAYEKNSAMGDSPAPSTDNEPPKNSDQVITKEIAEQFLADYDSVFLPYFTSMTEAAAESLSKHRWTLHLGGLTEISKGVATALSKHQGNLNLEGLTEISEGVAIALSKHQGELYLEGLTEISEGVAESLSKHQGTLHLEGLTEISEGVAESLSKHQGAELDLSGLTEISDAAAESLSKHQGIVSLKTT